MPTGLYLTHGIPRRKYGGMGGIPNETKYIWSKPLTEHKSRQISIYTQLNISVYNFVKFRLLGII